MTEHSSRLIKIESKTAPLPFWMPQACEQLVQKRFISFLWWLKWGCFYAPQGKKALERF